MLAAGLLVVFLSLSTVLVVARPIPYSRDHGSSMIAQIPASVAYAECASGKCDSRVLNRRNDMRGTGRSLQFVTIRPRQADIRTFTDHHRTHGGYSGFPGSDSHDEDTDEDSTFESERELVSIDGEVIVVDDGQVVSVEGEPSSGGGVHHVAVQDVAVHQHTS